MGVKKSKNNTPVLKKFKNKIKDAASCMKKNKNKGEKLQTFKKSQKKAKVKAEDAFVEKEVESEDDFVMEEQGSESEEIEDVQVENNEDEADMIPINSSSENEEEEVTPPQSLNKSKKEKSNKFPESNSTQNPTEFRVFIANVPSFTTEDSLSSFFDSNGLQLSDLFIPSNKNSNRDTGIAFASFKSQKDLDKAIALSGSEFEGLEISISVAKPRATKNDNRGNLQSSRILFVKNLPEGTTAEDMESHFDGCTDVRMSSGPDGSFRGFAFVEFADEETAKEKKLELQNSELNGSNVYIDYAAPRGDRNSSSSQRGFNSRRGGDRGFGGGRGRGSFRGNFGNRDNGNEGFRGSYGNSGRGRFSRGGSRFNRGSFGQNKNKHVKFDQD